jgi:hypothetical protein
LFFPQTFFLWQRWSGDDGDLGAGCVEVSDSLFEPGSLGVDMSEASVRLR